jgi:RNA polymerase sigma factor (sigma-70 family)
LSPSIPLRVLRTQSDVRLVELAREGHERAFEALVHRYRKPLLGYCRRLLLPEARAEDALQQGLLQAWLALSDGREVRDAKAWLYRIVHNAAVSALRRSGYDYVELDESLHAAGAPESDIDRRIAVREALAGLAALPEAQREVLLRTAVQGHSHEQVAAAMGLSDGAVRGLIYRARATLRSAATALMPPQAVLWAARAAETGASHPQLAGIAGGTGSAGLFGLLLKGGAVVLSAGVLATGASLVEHGAGTATTARADPARRSSNETPITSDLSARLTSSEPTPVLSLIAGDGTPGHQHHATGTSPAKGDHGSPSGSDRDATSGGALTGGGHDGRRGATGEEGGSGGDGEHGRGGPGPSGSGGSGDSPEAGQQVDGGSGQTSESSGSSGDSHNGGGSGGGSDQSGSSGGRGQTSPAPPPTPVEAAPAEPLSEADGGSSDGGGGSTSGSSASTDGSSESGSGH